MPESAYLAVEFNYKSTRRRGIYSLKNPREKFSKYKNEKYCAFFTTYQFSLAEIYPSRNLLMQQNFIFEIKRVELGADKLEEKEFKDK